MTDDDKIIALARADGFDWSTIQPFQGGAWAKRDGEEYVFFEPDKYLTSYDAILPLVRKWCGNNLDRWKVFAKCLMEITGIISGEYYHIVKYTFTATPTQISDALIRALGEWKE